MVFWSDPRPLFHVKQINVEMNYYSLFTDTELLEDHIQDILDIDAAKQPPQSISRRPQILGREFLALLEHRNAAVQHTRRLLQQIPLPFPRDQDRPRRLQKNLAQK